MCWEPLAEWGPLDSDFGDLSPLPTYKEDIVNFICYWQPCCRLPRFSDFCTSETHFLLSICQALISLTAKKPLYSAISLRIWQSFSFNWKF